MHRTRYSQFVFRNNTVCSGKQRGFPVIYRQSDEARQTKPPIISFPLISPLSWAIVQPAAGPLSRRQIGCQKRNGVIRRSAFGVMIASIDKGTRGSAGRKCPHNCVKALENTQSILCGLFLVCEHFCSGRTASHRTALDFRGIFVLLDAGGLSPAKDKRAKSTEKTGCPTCVLLLIDAISA